MFEIDKVQFGAFLLELRKEKGYTQKQLAEKAGVSRVTVNGIKSGRSCSDETAGKIAKALGVDVTEIIE